MSTWKDRVEAGKQTPGDLLISSAYSQFLIIKHNFKTRPLKTGIGALLTLIGAVWIVAECVKKPWFILLYAGLFFAVFLIGKKGKRHAN